MRTSAACPCSVHANRLLQVRDLGNQASLTGELSDLLGYTPVGVRVSECFTRVSGQSAAVTYPAPPAFFRVTHTDGNLTIGNGTSALRIPLISHQIVPLLAKYHAFQSTPP